MIHNGLNGRGRLAILSVTVIALAVVLYFMQDPATERIVMLLSFLGGITAALLKIGQVERKQDVLNGEVQSLHTTIAQAVPKVHEAAHMVEEVAPTIEQAAQHIAEAAPRIEDAAKKAADQGPSA